MGEWVKKGAAVTKPQIIIRFPIDDKRLFNINSIKEKVIMRVK